MKARYPPINGVKIIREVDDAHNAKYIIQVLYDSIADLSDASGLARPEGSTVPECGDIGFPFPTGDLTMDCIVDC